jgi:hypothetical protein
VPCTDANTQPYTQEVVLDGFRVVDHLDSNTPLSDQAIAAMLQDILKVPS